MCSDLVFYGERLIEIKDRIRQGQTWAALSANAEMIAMYWDIGRMIHQRQKEKGWGTGIIPQPLPMQVGRPKQPLHQPPRGVALVNFLLAS